METETLESFLQQAKKYGACRSTLKIIREKYRTIEAALEDERAPAWLYWYAKKVIKGRWIEGEPIIARSDEYIYAYTLWVEWGL